MVAEVLLPSMDPTPWIGLAALVDDVGAKNLHRLINATGSAEAAWTANRATIERAGISQRAAERFTEVRATVKADALSAAVERHGITVIPWGDPRYPTLLSQIPDPPICLFVRGNAGLLTERSLAVVGTRTATLYGRSVAELIVGPLARAGLVIVSGLALGVDAYAHSACLTAQGRTIAVLGTGVDDASIYPANNRGLAARIHGMGGCLASEYVPDTEPYPMHFPARNRIVAGLTVGTLVIEAPEDSGALITAQFALDFGREVFAVPGPVTQSMSAGANALLKVGATPVTTAADIIDALHLEELLPPTPTRPAKPDGIPGRILDALGSAPLHIDDLRERMGMNASELAITLTSLELDGAIRDIGGSRYVKVQ